MKVSTHSLWAALLLALCGIGARGQELPIPQLKSLFPCGARQGTSVEVEVGGGDLDGTTKLYFSNPGITAELIPESAPPADPKKAPPARFKVSVAAGVPVGDYDVRAIAKLGISNPRVFCVSDCAEVNETEPNDVKEKANRVPLESIVNGRVSPSEDVDWFVFAAKKGQRVLVECRAWRIDSRLDGTLYLYNGEGKELAASQDENIRDQKRDPFIDFDVPADGDYFLKFTDFIYDGGNDYFYRLSIGTQPYVDYITPTGARPGSTAEITFYGRNLPGGEPTDVKVNGRPLEKVVRQIAVPAADDDVTGFRFGELLRPSTSRVDGMEVRIAGEHGCSNAKMLLFGDGPELLETEPNDNPNQAQRLSVPCALTGQFGVPKDADDFVFTAKKDEKFVIQVSAERIGSPAAPNLEISGPDGKVVATAESFNENIGQLRFATTTRDVVYNFTAPKDGDFTIRLEHLYGQVQGGAQYQYRLEIQKQPAPDFRLVCAPAHDIHIDSHAVYRGGRQRLDVLVWRINGYDEPVTVEARNLPPGVTAEPIVLGKGMKWATLVVTAAPDAPIGEGEIEVLGEGLRGQERLVRKARGGVVVWDTVNTPAISRVTRSIVLAVREAAPFSVGAAPAAMTVKLGEPVNVTVTATRREDMPSAIQLNGAGIDLPPGLTIPTTTIDAGQTVATLSVATDKMKEGVYSFIINAEAQVPGATDKKIRCIYPSNALTITVEPKAAK